MASTAIFPPLLRLPVELHQDIKARLSFQDNVRLSMTNCYFYSIIPSPTHEELLAVESGTWATAKALFTCKVCVRLRRMEKFEDEMRKCRRSRNGAEAATRFCIDCGINRGWYKPGMEITIMGEPWVITHACRTFTDRTGTKATCDSCAAASKQIQKKTNFPYSGGQYDQDGEWDHLTRSCSKGSLSDELYVFDRIIEEDL